ncbi:hypothetical protein YH66_14320 [[Brevibacterium] flavum]|uniref:Uncharacterized protein n=1 Tax=[Brevibacterium] flavum TaxID=92706 RepID=A0A0F6Z6Q6_9CORY|nr:hypothetical protein YH66_14320 [[Brevibacterium] flavum]ANE09470.1 hypothetical protein A3654_14515 [Corynebacterium glutamicum]AST21860.1 hypothetical protein CEY17_14575 [Corynebacterium glutamicum ATCC 14067]KEI24402.1 hypothetical protein KIQ_002230 [Corynebacterium glutamicum ATCC 14067]KIH72498.1 hypothetical protein SD36_14375 [Corynebacterium glutamicum]
MSVHSDSSRPLEAIVEGVGFGTIGAPVIPVSLLIKDPPQSCGQTFKSNVFLHQTTGDLQKSTTNG